MPLAATVGAGHPLRRRGRSGRLRRHAHRHRLLQRLLHGPSRHAHDERWHLCDRHLARQEAQARFRFRKNRSVQLVTDYEIKFLLPVRLSARQASRYYARPYTARKRAGRKNVLYADSPQAAGYRTHKTNESNHHYSSFGAKSFLGKPRRPKRGLDSDKWNIYFPRFFKRDKIL